MSASGTKLTHKAGQSAPDRRSLMKILAGTALLRVTGANAAKSFTIAYLALLPSEDRASFMARFMRRLNELGYRDGQNLRLIYRSAEGQPELLPGLASALVTFAWGTS
jgi:putative tryptophan/tyrosine transport system substrate-binding protein